MAAYCDMALLFFIKREPPLPEVKHPASGFFALDDSKFQLYSNFSQALVNYSEKPNCSKLPWNRAIISSLMYQGSDYQITDVIQLNRAKFIFNRAEKRKPECYANNIQVDTWVTGDGSRTVTGHIAFNNHAHSYYTTKLNLNRKEKTEHP